MTSDLKGLRDALLHHLIKHGKKHSMEILRRVNFVVDWKKIPLDDKDISHRLELEVKIEGFEHLTDQKEVRDPETRCMRKERFAYWVKYGF